MPFCDGVEVRKGKREVLGHKKEPISPKEKSNMKVRNYWPPENILSTFDLLMPQAIGAADATQTCCNLDFFCFIVF